MDAAAYEAYADELTANLVARREVLGLVAVGSFAVGADRFSDHDFFVIAPAEATESLRRDLTWLPAHERLVITIRETQHGIKAVYDDGHLVEYAVFSPDEIALARLNRTRVLFDRADVSARIAATVEATKVAVRDEAHTDGWLVGQFLATLLIGVSRHRRGERLAAIEFVHGLALRSLLLLIARHVPADEPGVRDDLNPYRRVERAYPALGAQLDLVMARGDLEAVASGLFEVAEPRFAALGHDDVRPAAWTTLRRLLDER
jgi:hypothetical protein